MARDQAPWSKPTRSRRDASQKIRLRDIAEMTGVGMATVDRVLNERGKATPETARKILAVARRPKLERLPPASHRRRPRIQIILARPELSPIARVNRQFAKLAERADRSIVIQRTILESEAPSLLADLTGAARRNRWIQAQCRRQNDEPLRQCGRGLGRCARLAIRTGR